MMSEKLSQRLQEKFQKLEEKTQHQPFAGKLIGSSTLLGAGVGGAMKMAGKGVGVGAGAVQGFKAGTIASLLILGGAGIAQLIKRAKDKGAAETKQSIKRAMSNAQSSDKYTNTQKAAIRNNGEAAIAKIDRVFKNQKKHESFDIQNESESTKEFKNEDPQDNAEKTEIPESLGRSILERLDRMVEEGSAKKAAAAGAIGGAVVGHQVRKQNTRKAVAKAVTQRKIARDGVKAAAANTKQAVNNAGAAKTILNKESRHAAQLAKKNPSGVLDKLKNHSAKLAQKGRVKAAAQNLQGHPEVAKGLAKQAKANANFAKSDAALKTAKNAMRKVGKFGGAGKGALIGAAVGAGAYGLHKLANKNK